MLPLNQIIQADALTTLQQFEANTIDLVVTDPPYGYAFMNKEWDKAVVGVETWRECLRVLKPGAFAFIMSSPRQDVLSRMIVNLQDAGFRTDFTSIYWTYASGFPKAADISKLVDKRNGRTQETYKPFADYIKQKRLEKGLTKDQIDNKLGTVTLYSWFEGRPVGIELPTRKYYLQLKQILELDNRFDELIEREEAEREIICKGGKAISWFKDNGIYITKPATDAAKALDGSYGGFQPKPAVEVILVLMKPLSEKSFTDQALANGKGITWLDSVRIPYQNEDDTRQSFKEEDRINDYRNWSVSHGYRKHEHTSDPYLKQPNQKGRFPANLLVSDDVLNDGRITKSSKNKPESRLNFNRNLNDDNWNKKGIRQSSNGSGYGDLGSYSRYFDLDKWYETTFPFAIIPKASKAEKNRGLDQWIPTTVNDGRKTEIDNPFQRGETPRINRHPTVKPIKLMSYLIMLGSRSNDIVLDPFCGSGTTCIAAQQLKRQWIGIELNKEYTEIALSRLGSYKSSLLSIDNYVTTA